MTTSILRTPLHILLIIAACASFGCRDIERRGGTIARPSPAALDSPAIWHELFPADHHFDDAGRLQRTVVRGTDELELHSTIGRIFRYRAGEESRAVVVVYSYDMSDGRKMDCQACFPQMDVATFVWKAGAWRKLQFEQNWKGAAGSAGAPAPLSFDTSSGKPVMAITAAGATPGATGPQTAYFDAETLVPAPAPARQ